MKLEDLQTPCYIVDEDLLVHNLEILRALRERSGCEILLAQKAFSMFYLYPLIGQYLSGTAASGLYEARLGAEEMGKENHIFSPAYREEDFPQIVSLCSHIIFNSFSQLLHFGPFARAQGVSVGLRLNPEHSTQADTHAIYDPCAPFSRLGVPLGAFQEQHMGLIDGFHFHTLCEQDAEPLAETLAVIEQKFGAFLPRLQWINFGGGHHITRAGYNLPLLERCIRRMRERYGLRVYLEPGEAVALNAGFLATRVLDVVHNGMDIAVLDASAACHMPDVLEVPYRPPLLNEAKDGTGQTYRLAGPTCLAGDVIGDYTLPKPLQPGDMLLFGDMAIYSMVKNNTFNGMPLPAIAVRKADGEYEVVRRFSYADFKSRLS